MRYAFFVVLLAFPLLAQDCVLSSRAFRKPVASPDGRYVVSNVFCSNQEHELALVLRNRKSGKARTLYRYDRDASVVWSPDSRWVAINDFAGSDFTNNLLVSIDPSISPISLKERLLRSEPNQKALKSDHLYIAATEWQSPTEIELLVYGHDSERRTSFCRCFRMSLQGMVRQCRLPNGKDSEDYCVRLEIRSEKDQHLDSKPGLSP